MLVQAKCVVKTWESNHAFMFEPGGGPLPGGLYEIDRDGALASLKAAGRYVFDFDRNAGPDDKPHIYTCKKPGCESLKPFKTLNDLGTHTRTAHKDEPNPLAEPDAEVVVAVDGRGKRKGGFTCKTEGCGVHVNNLHELKAHKKTHKDAVAVAA